MTSLHILLTVLGVIAVLGALVIFVWLHCKKTGYSIISHAVSDYAVGAAKQLARVSTVWSGTTVLLFAGVIATMSQDFSFKWWAVGLLLVTAVARYSMLWAPTDLEDATEKTREGRIHMVLAVLHFALTYTVINNLSQYLATQSDWQPYAPWLTLIMQSATIGLVVLCLGLIVKPLYRYIFGLSERLFLVSQNVWFLAFGVAILLMQAR